MNTHDLLFLGCAGRVQTALSPVNPDRENSTRRAGRMEARFWAVGHRPALPSRPTRRSVWPVAHSAHGLCGASVPRGVATWARGAPDLWTPTRLPASCRTEDRPGTGLSHAPRGMKRRVVLRRRTTPDDRSLQRETATGRRPPAGPTSTSHLQARRRTTRSRNVERQPGQRERLRSACVADLDPVLKLRRHIAGLGVAVGNLPLEDCSQVH